MAAEQCTISELLCEADLLWYLSFYLILIVLVESNKIHE